VARFIYGPKGTEASKSEEIGRLEIYDPTLPHLTSPYLNQLTETDKEQGPEDWTEVIVASCDLVVQYWRKMGRRYNSRMMKVPKLPVRTNDATAAEPQIQQRSRADSTSRSEVMQHVARMASDGIHEACPLEGIQLTTCVAV